MRTRVLPCRLARLTTPRRVCTASPSLAHKHRERRGDPRRPQCRPMLNAANRDGAAAPIASTCTPSAMSPYLPAADRLSHK